MVDAAAIATVAAPVANRGRRLGGLGGRTLLIALALALAVAAADRSGVLVDCSADRRYTLSDSLLRLLHGQDAPVEFVGLWTSEQSEFARAVADGLALMAAEDRHLSFRRIAPDLHKPLLAQFSERYHEASWPAVYVCRGDRAFKIPLTAGSRFTLQRDVGGALAALADPHPPVAWISQGHGELRRDGGGDDGADALLRGLALAGFSVQTLDLTTGGRVPAGSVLVIAGPTASFGKRNLDALDEHLADGGGAVVLADDRCPADLAALLRRRGVILGSSVPEGLLKGDLGALFDANAPTLPAVILVSLRHHLAGQEIAFPHHNLVLDENLMNSGHPATAAVARSGQQLLSPWTTPIEAWTPDRADKDAEQLKGRYRAAGTPPFTATPLLATAAKDAWSKRRQDPLQAPAGLANAPSLPIAWALDYAAKADSVRQGQGARLAVWGSRQAASNAVLNQGGLANTALLCELCRWSIGRGPAADIPATETASFGVQASDRTLLILTGLLVALVPCLALGGAMIAWWERR